MRINPSLLNEEQPIEARKRTQSFPLVILLKQAVFSAMERIFDNKIIKVQSSGEKEIEQALLRLNRLLETKKFEIGRLGVEAEQLEKLQIGNLETLNLENVQSLSLMAQQLEPIIKGIKSGNQLNHQGVIALNKVLVSLGVLSQKVLTLKPKDFPLKEITSRLDRLTEQVSNIRLEVPAPQEIKIPEMPESIGIDEGEEIIKSLKKINKSVEESVVEFPTEADNPISVRLSDGERFYNAIPNAIRSFASGASIPKVDLGSNEEAASVASGLTLRPYDYVSLNISSATETYTFKRNGSGGTTVNTVVIVYTDSGRTDISTVTKT